MPKAYSEWSSLCKKGTFPNVVAFCGDERALIEEAIGVLRKEVLSQGLADFNHDRINGKSSSFAQIIDSANALPVMADKRLVEVIDADGIASDDLEALSAYLVSPNPSTVLLLHLQGADARNKVVKVLDEKGFAFKFDHPSLDQMPAIAANRARAFSLNLDSEVAQLLVMETGTSLLLLDRALEKLALVAVDGRVTPDDVAEQVAQMALQDAFSLARAVATGDRMRAERFLAELEMAHELPLRLVGMLSWQLRQVLKARLLIDRGLGDREIGKELSIYGDRLQPILSTARKWRKETHVLRLSRLCQLDRELKSSRATSWLWLEKMVMQLCPVSAARA
jgi:DNA polymerase-3 subunit delta